MSSEHTEAITEADLHAYVDGQLPAARHAEIEAWLAGNPDEAARLHAYRAQNHALRGLFDPVRDEPLPESLRTLATAPAMTIRNSWLPRWSLQRIAAGFAIAMVSGLTGWLAHDQYRPVERLAQATPLSRQAAVAHVVFSPDVRRPVEISAEHEDQLVTWLSKRLGTPVSPPKLGTLGFELIGGRLLPGNSGPVAQFMYHDASGQRLTLYVSTENASNRDTAFRFAREGPVNVFYWVDGKFGYALSAGIAKNELARVATAVYEQLEK
jgi:anti-sigma factor RsiW